MRRNGGDYGELDGRDAPSVCPPPSDGLVYDNLVINQLAIPPDNRSAGNLAPTENTCIKETACAQPERGSDAALMERRPRYLGA